MVLKKHIRRWALEAGACRCGFAVAEPVDDAHWARHQGWIDAGMHGEMDYCAKYADVRRDPRLLLDGARTVIVCAFNYHTDAKSPLIASYALGQDYHYVLKSRLMALAQRITEEYGGECRAVVDTAPIPERYWAIRSGVGFQGLNGQLIVDGVGSYVFIGILLWTGEVEPDDPNTGHCLGCMACVKACPGQALDGTGRCDARRCASYLTIEYRGDLPDDARLGGMAYGCDRCQTVCPHNAKAPVTTIPEFQPRAEILSLDREAIMEMTPSHYKKLVATSAMRRAPLKQLQRNLGAAQGEK
ncbi:MAG: tRNA epoxyqueuosine(34) reductase QueG [Bacteroidales bacterium]|nr:tRNA epoxyqueuosine(34) reductase QueG [Bacteroidales bacterium]